MLILAGSTVIQIGLCTPPQRISNQTIKIWLEMQIYSFNSQACFYHPEDWAVDFRHALTANYFHPRIIHIPIFKIIKVCPIGCNSWTVNVMHLLKHFQLKLYVWIASGWCTEVKLRKNQSLSKNVWIHLWFHGCDTWQTTCNSPTNQSVTGLWQRELFCHCFKKKKSNVLIIQIIGRKYLNIEGASLLPLSFHCVIITWPIREYS